MTEYWVSKQSYFCKYCDIYIRDDAPSRAQHENGLRHKGNLERYIRDIYKKEDRVQKERTDEEHQISKINEAARLAHQEKDLTDGACGSTQSNQEEKLETTEDEGAEMRKRVKYNKQDWKGAENLHNYSDARSLGLIDTDAEFEAAAVAEAEKELRAKEGRVGQWEAVVKLESVQKQDLNLKSKNYQEKLVSKLSNDRDSDKKPIRKLFTERSLENESYEETLDGMEIKLKVDRRLQAQKLERNTPSPDIHGSIQPIRLDGLQDESNEPVKKDHPGSTFSSVPPQDKITDDEDIKPKIEELELSTPTILFKKRKLKNSQPRQKI